jgi:3-oxoadipate enol-lactonase
LLSLSAFEDAPRVLLLGGSNFDLRLKRSFLGTALTEQCHVATYEPRGIGRTEQPSGEWSMRDYALDALALLDALGWQNAHVIGESFGGMTALHVALLAPTRIRSITVSSATAGGAKHASYDIAQFLKLPREEAAKQAMALQDTRNVTSQNSDPQAFETALKQRQEFERQFADPSISSGGYARLLSARAGHDCVAELELINVPVTVICGKYDLQARPDSQQALVDALPTAQFEMFEAGHGVLFARPEATECAVRAVVAANVE